MDTQTHAALVAMLKTYHAIVEDWPSRSDKHSLELQTVAYALTEAAEAITDLTDKLTQARTQLADCRTMLQATAEAAATHLKEITQARAEIARLREALEKIAPGDYQRPLGEIYRQDKVRSKHDKCVHGQAMYEDCEGCIYDFALAALKDTTP